MLPKDTVITGDGILHSILLHVKESSDMFDFNSQIMVGVLL